MKTLSFITTTTFKQSKVSFDVYDVENFDFEDNLDFPEETKGVYVFAYRCKDSINANFRYKIYYIGRTKNLRKRFYHHHKADDLTEGTVFNVLCVHKCKTIEQTISMEKELIELYKPEYNNKLNPEYKD